MKNPDFVDPEVAEQVVFKQEIFNDLKKWLSLGPFTPKKKVVKILEWIKWLDSITNEVALTPNEAIVIYKFLGITDEDIDKTDMYKPALLFFDNSSFFYHINDDSAFLLLNRFFRTDLLDDERIKSIPLLFEKYNDKETFHPRVERLIEKIRAHCVQNEEFAEAYQAKLAEIRNNNGSLQKRLALYIDFYQDQKKGIRCAELILELEQPTLKILGESVSSPMDLIRKLLFLSLVQTPDGMQIPCWNEENYICRLLLDYEITDNSGHPLGILDKLFRDYTTTDVVLTICNHLKWRNDNMPQYPVSNSKEDKENHRKEYVKFLESQLPELFSSDIPQEYSYLLHDCFFTDIYTGFGVDEDEDMVPLFAYYFLFSYLTKKIESAIIENNHEQILEISHLFDNDNKVLRQIIDRKPRGGGWEELRLQSQISSAMKFFENGDHAEKWRDILRASKGNDSFLKSLLSSLVKSQKDKTSPLSLEDFMQQYIPLEIFPQILYYYSSLFEEQNEDVYQSMKKQYPSLTRKEALLDRLLPCFTALAIKNLDEMLTMDCLGGSFRHGNTDPSAQLFLCVLEQLCKRHEKEHVLITLIYEIIFRDKYYFPTIIDIIKKYPQVQQLIFEHCYTILNGSWNTSICLPISSRQIEVGVPACIIGMHKGPWHGLKPLLIALRKTRMEWVNASLGINSECPPNGNKNLVDEIEFYFYFFRESLRDLRQNMANGFSDWLKPLPESKRGNLEKRLAEFPEIEKDRKGFDITYTEPDPVWRYAYVRAIADLGVDVDGKGHYIHSVMDMVAKEDPSEMVRTAAEKVSAKLKTLRNGWDGDDHEQKINLAFWWIKQASRLALNLPIDERKSLETRSHTGRKKDYYEKIDEIKKREEQMIEEYMKKQGEERVNKERVKPWKEDREEKQRENEKLMQARLRI